MFFLLSVWIFISLVEIVAVIGEPHTGQQGEEKTQQREEHRNTNRLEQRISCAFLDHAVENIKVGRESREKMYKHPPPPILRRVALQSSLRNIVLKSLLSHNKKGD